MSFYPTRAGYAELVAGEPMPLEDTFAARREFVKQRRQQHEVRRQRIAGEQAQRAKRGTLRPDVAESVCNMPVLAIADVGMHPQAGMTKSTRPRKRADVAEGADAAGVETNGHNACASQRGSGVGEQTPYSAHTTESSNTFLSPVSRGHRADM